MSHEDGAAQPEELTTARDELKRALNEPHDPALDHVIDAMLALLAYVEKLPAPIAAEPKEDA